MLKLVLSLMAVLSMASACLSQPHPVKNRFTLAAPEAPEGAVDAAGRRTLLVGAVTAAPAYEGRALVYRLGQDRYESDFYNEFLAPPTRLLAEVAADLLTRASRRLRVVASPGLAVADFGLETHIQDLYGDFSRTPPRAVLTLRFILNDLRPTAAKVVLDRRYSCERPLAEPGGAAELVAAHGLCLAEILAELARDMDGAI
jgi:cholesterol transport system auxiliary component